MFTDVLYGANIEGDRRIAKVGDVEGTEEEEVVLGVALRQAEGSRHSALSIDMSQPHASEHTVAAL